MRVRERERAERQGEKTRERARRQGERTRESKSETEKELEKKR